MTKIVKLQGIHTNYNNKTTFLNGDKIWQKVTEHS